jgi:hypothetical protein
LEAKQSTFHLSSEEKRESKEQRFQQAKQQGKPESIPAKPEHKPQCACQSKQKLSTASTNAIARHDL